MQNNRIERRSKKREEDNQLTTKITVWFCHAAYIFFNYTLEFLPEFFDSLESMDIRFFSLNHFYNIHSSISRQFIKLLLSYAPVYFYTN